MILKPVLRRAVADQDIADAVNHYRDEAGEKTALNFVQALEHAIDHIARHPASGSPRHAHDLDLPGLRSWPLKRFPYLVFYLERDDHIDVWRVLRQERDIPAWMGEGDT